MKTKVTKKNIILFLCLVLVSLLFIPRQISTERFANKQIKDLNVACCLCVRNCEQYLPKIFDNLNKLSKEFTNFYVIFIYDNCTDKSEKLLQEDEKASKYKVIIKHITNDSPYRTFRIAKARNTYVSILYNELPDIDFHFVIDSDDKNINPWNINILKKYLMQNTWDALSFNRPFYYDTWALFYENIKHHFLGYSGAPFAARKVGDYMRNDISKKINNMDDNNLFICLSAFNGFAIYRTPQFKNIKYDGSYKSITTLITDNERTESLEYLKKTLNMPNLIIDQTKEKLPSRSITVYSAEHCEHVFYHISAIKKNNARIRISKFIL